MKSRSIYNIMLCNNVIYKLIQQQINYTVNIAYKIFKLKKELDEIEQLMLERWECIFGKEYDINQFTDEEIKTYNMTLNVEIDVDCYDLTIEDIVNNDKVSLSIEDIEIIDNFLK